jgi:hypothetical protein
MRAGIFRLPEINAIDYSIGEAVTDLFLKERQNRLPQIPVGGATSDPEVQATWDAFDKWIHRQGPPPDLK